MATLKLNDFNQNRYNLKLTKGLAKLLLSVGIVVVVEHYSDGFSGYNLYANGFCEQWGQLASSPNNSVKTVTLLKPYKDTKYVICTDQKKCASRDGAGDTIGSTLKDNTSFNIWHGWYGGNCTTAVDWQTKGWTDYAL